MEGDIVHIGRVE